ncbi:MAG: hypothetical protein ACRETW_04650 [Stenotrophobium sp.]
MAQLDDLFKLMQQLLESDGAVHKALDAQLQQRYEADPSSRNRIRLALSLMVPGHGRADLDQAQRLIAGLHPDQNAPPDVLDKYLRILLDARKRSLSVEEKAKDLSDDNKSLSQENDNLKAQIKALTQIDRKLEKPNARTVPN